VLSFFFKLLKLSLTSGCVRGPAGACATCGISGQVLELGGPPPGWELTLRIVISLMEERKEGEEERSAG
jgi:hypothetical protein